MSAPHPTAPGTTERCWGLEISISPGEEWTLNGLPFRVESADGTHVYGWLLIAGRPPQSARLRLETLPDLIAGRQLVGPKGGGR